MSARIDAMTPAGYDGTAGTAQVGTDSGLNNAPLFQQALNLGGSLLTRWADVETYRATGGNMAPGGTAVRPLSGQAAYAYNAPGSGIPPWAILAGVALVAVLVLKN